MPQKNICFLTPEMEMCIETQCIPEGDRLIIEQKMFAAGSYGQVYRGQWKGNDGYSENIVVKVIPLDVAIPDYQSRDCVVHDPETYEDCLRTKTSQFEQELRQFEVLSRLGVTPKFYGGTICSVKITNVEDLPEIFRAKKVGIIVSQFVDMTLSEAFDEFNSKTLRRILKPFYKKLYDNHIKIYDSHPGNFGVVLTNERPVKMFLIDAGDDIEMDPNFEVYFEKEIERLNKEQRMFNKPTI